MSLKEKIVTDLTAAMKAREADRTSTLRMVKAAISNREIEKGSPLTDDEITKLLNTLVKQRRDSAAQYEQGGRPELAAKEQAEIGVIDVYLPQVATDEQLASAVDAAISETGATTKRDMGVVMKAAQSKLTGLTVDGRLLSEQIKAKLS